MPKCECCDKPVNSMGGGHMEGCVPHKECKGEGCEDCYGGRHYLDEEEMAAYFDEEAL